MSSCLIEIIRENYPSKSDAESARAYAQEHGYLAIVRYKSNGALDFTHIGICRMESEISSYLTSPYCSDAEVIYDGRPTALRITDDLILRGHCELCGKRATSESLNLSAGNDFYICPKCEQMFCDGCYDHLPLTSSPGYGMCPKCRVQVQRAISGLYGKRSGAL